MKKVKRISAIIIAVIFLSSFFAIPVNAVDPISATAIANGFAQAITAYGAANGVSLTFDGIDSENTAQIGEAIHDLWSRFRADQQTTDDYLTIGEALMPSLFYKAEKAAGTAAIGISIAQQYMPDIDAFWNWVLSGPAEMVKVDNAYNWNPNSQGIIEPINVYHANFANGSLLAVPPGTIITVLNNQNYGFSFRANPSYSSFYVYFAIKNNSSEKYLVFYNPYLVNTAYYPQYSYTLNPNENTSWSNLSSSYKSNYLNQYFYYKSFSTNDVYGLNSAEIPTYYVDPLPTGNPDNYATWYDPAWVFGLNSTNPNEQFSVQNVNVQLYVGDPVAKPVPIPDTTDPDYGPIPWTGDLDIPWNDTLFGDGTGVLTNEQTTDIIGTIDQAIVANPDKTIELEGEQDIPVNPSPSEIIIPFLPVEVPSFNFSLSGIWHYVREWVNSLGSWFALVFTVWGILPYALVVPVYATAVIVIVLGVYKRFFM